MALQFFDGFDDYGTSNLSSYSSIYANVPTPDATTAGLFGGTALGYSGIILGSNMLRQLATPVSTFYMGARFLCAGNVGSSYPNGLIFTDTNGNTLCSFYLNINGGIGSIQVNGPAGSLYTASFVTQYNFWYELEAELFVNSASGSFTGKINGATVVNLTNINTQGSYGSTIGYAGPSIIEGTTYANGYVDDLYGCDSTGSAPLNTFLSTVAGAMGPRVYTLFPNGNSSVSWSPSPSGNNYANINSPTFQTADFNYATSAGLQDLYTIPTPLAQVGSAVGTILAVQTTFVGNENDAGICQVSNSIKSGGTTYQGATRTMLQSVVKYADIYVNDPATSTAWSPTKFNTTGNVFIGVERIT